MESVWRLVTIRLSGVCDAKHGVNGVTETRSSSLNKRRWSVSLRHSPVGRALLRQHNLDPEEPHLRLVLLRHRLPLADINVLNTEPWFLKCACAPPKIKLRVFVPPSPPCLSAAGPMLHLRHFDFYLEKTMKRICRILPVTSAIQRFATIDLILTNDTVCVKIWLPSDEREAT